jgi:hypothetical protein
MNSSGYAEIRQISRTGGFCSLTDKNTTVKDFQQTWLVTVVWDFLWCNLEQEYFDNNATQRINCESDSCSKRKKIQNGKT